jgi:hypothetical protein
MTDTIAYDAIAANVAQVLVEGAQVQVTWKCPVTGRTVATSTAGMVADNSLGNRVGASIKRSLASEVIYGAARLITGFVGGAAGRIISNAVYTAAGDIDARSTAGVDYTQASREAAIVAAFDAVKPQFVWDTARNQFVARPSASTEAA